jgi:hypothetical protein
MACTSSTATAVALRGRSLRIAISPKNSPGPSVARVRSPLTKRRESRTRPRWITYIFAPGSVSRKITPPAGNSRQKRAAKGVGNHGPGTLSSPREAGQNARGGMVGFTA